MQEDMKKIKETIKEFCDKYDVGIEIDTDYILMPSGKKVMTYINFKIID